jgi:hypothetical protein
MLFQLPESLLGVGLNLKDFPTRLLSFRKLPPVAPVVFVPASEQIVKKIIKNGVN